MSSTTNIKKSSAKSKWLYTGYGIAFDGGDSWSFDNYFVKNFMICDVNNSSSSHSDYFLELVKELIYDVNGSYSASEKKLIIF